MNATVTISENSYSELDRVVRESLHLADGDRVVVEVTEGGLVVRREQPDLGSIQENGSAAYDNGVDVAEEAVHLEDRDGLLVVCGGPRLPENSIVDLIRTVREERDRETGGW